VLLQLDTGDVQIEIEKTQSELDAAKRRQAVGSSTALELVADKELLTEFERQNKLGLASDADLIRQQRRLKGTQQRLDLEQIANQLTIESLENVLKGQKRKLEKMTLRAPFDGVISYVYARPGDLIPGGAPIATLISISRTVEGRLSEENISGVKTGQKAVVSFLPYGDDRFDAKVLKVLSTSDPQTQRYLIHLEVDPKQLPLAKLVPGITGEVSVILDERPSKTIVPRRAVFGGKVFVVNGGRVELRSVKTGYVSLTAVEVTEGVSEGEQVIVDQLDRFSDGRSVRAVLTDDGRWR
jgi:RND family efflux transporter MFP subunit